MSVVKSKRHESRLEVLVQVDRLAKELTDLMIRNFGTKDVNAMARRQYAYGKDVRENPAHYRFLISEYKNAIVKDLKLLNYHIDSANAIHPTNLVECDERRRLQDLALGNCDHIKHELQQFCDDFDVRIADYRIPIFELDREIELLKKWRRSDNRIRKKISQRGGI